MFVNQDEDFVKGDLIIANIIKNIFTIQEFHIVDFKEDADDAYEKDILKAVFQDSLHSSSDLIVKKRVKAFINKLFDQAGTLYSGCEIISFLVF